MASFDEDGAAAPDPLFGAVILPMFAGCGDATPLIKFDMLTIPNGCNPPIESILVEVGSFPTAILMLA